MGLVDIFLIILLVLVLLYLYLDRAYSYWARKGVPHVRPTSLIFGNAKKIFFGEEHSSTFYGNVYRQFPEEPLCGLYEFQNPVLLIRDLQIIQTVLVEKFNCFHDNKFRMSEKNDEVFGLNPFVLTGSRWKEKRAIFVAGMTTNKIKILDDIVKTVYMDMSKYITSNSKDIEMHDLASRFTSETVAMYGWGIRSDGFSHNSMIKEEFDKLELGPTFVTLLVHPLMAYWLKVRFFPPSICNFFRNVTHQLLNNTEKSKMVQPSLIKFLMATKEKLKNSGKDFTLKDIVGQLGTFFIDGYDTTARILGYTLYSLMLHPEVQQKLREEILNKVEDITIESVNQLEYLDMVFSEVTRLHPPVPYLGRKCTVKCLLGSTEIDVGTDVVIPSLSIHLDPNYYPNPENFNPDNFSEENKRSRHKFSHMPFGQGPRICAGMKFATAEIKLLLCYLLKEFEIITPIDHPVIPIKPGLKSLFVYITDDEHYLRFKKL